MEVILIRHTSVDVPKGTCYGHTDVPVAATFEQEAEATKQNLAQYLPFDAVYASPLTRARLLASYCGYPQPRLDNRLKEMHMGDWEMQRFDEINDPQLRKYYENYLDSPTRNGESFKDLYRRVAAFIEELKAEDARLAAGGRSSQRNIAVFCHGGPIICAMVYACLVPIEQGYANIPDYATVTHLEL